MTENNSAAEEVTVKVNIKRWVISDALRQELKADGWFGAIINFENSVTDQMQMSKDGKQLSATVGDVVVSVNDVLSSITSDDYVSRYGALPS
jgi:hypothetical protein